MWDDNCHKDHFNWDYELAHCTDEPYIQLYRQLRVSSFLGCAHGDDFWDSQHGQKLAVGQLTAAIGHVVARKSPQNTSPCRISSEAPTQVGGILVRLRVAASRCSTCCVEFISPLATFFFFRLVFRRLALAKKLDDRPGARFFAGSQRPEALRRSLGASVPRGHTDSPVWGHPRGYSHFAHLLPL